MPDQPIRRGLTRLGALSAHPAAFLVVLGFGAVWWAVQPDTLDWHGAATLATWLMTLFIQRAAHRDTQALQHKLDELVRAVPAARNEVAGIDEREPEEIADARRAGLEPPAG